MSQLFNEIDTDKSGNINYFEFRNMLWETHDMLDAMVLLTMNYKTS